ncbi:MULTISPECIES: amino acid ABC transporter substrate-binding protein [unclassified Moorena]|uniref:amino acid ABC transporter substrate-binding protein n=1 Tax=unclassified Moorena TaxID=2683338 RepID=UPI0013B83A3C|nr:MULTISPECIES: amino acid ABC transporter substrate-binding protein [unclassified Moorena]NEQ13081.1 amino acid ABC transporter substrate-binding protein [Moorena sp. SIO3E2]NES84697.1 amino acid ABC transporter substrate-binding protein [Moorena sp. SIO2B7]NER92003.1 amino acid ABC transporter substrate-binding protein [Moorena sp. SIO3A2]NES42963.1 amino acid ABC transporter substrate-binding protein [Moorena sp. SIO2C4]NET63089.1 amino acid ABC transporter substrate-binding protein [Moore
MPKWSSLVLATLVLVAPLTACEGGGTSAKQSRLDIVKSRGKLICGVDGGIPGFSFVDGSGNYSGLDVDVCKAVAAALFDDPKAVEYRNLDSTERFPAVRNGEVDMLSRNTTWTLSRDSSTNNLEFAPTTFYDGQGMMVRKNSGIKTLKDFKGKSVCVETGTTTELNLTDKMREAGVEFEPVVFQKADPAYTAYNEERCDGMTSDKSQLLAKRSTLPKPDDHVLLDVTMSKEPLGPVTINNDSAWFDVVKWVTFALIEAEELGITKANVAQMSNSPNPTVKRFVGVEGELGKGLGLENDFAARVIKHVGNYGEVYDRNLGKNSQFKLNRGLNDLWTRGGILYSPPFR